MASGDLVEVAVRLPRRLADWLQGFSRAIAMTPDQLLANILEYYYEAWAVGYREGSGEGRRKTREGCLEELFSAIREYRGHGRSIVRRFAEWVCERGLEVGEASVGGFLSEYAGSRDLSGRTLRNYRRELLRFAEFLKSRGSGTG